MNVRDTKQCLIADNDIVDDNGISNNKVGNSMLEHVLVCSVSDKDTQKHNASGDEVDTTYLDNIKTSETKNEHENAYKYKIVESGNVIEIYTYSHEIHETIFDDDECSNERAEVIIENKAKEMNSALEYKRSESTINETKRRLKRWINANVGQYPTKDKFITLTFEEFLTREEVIKSFKHFNKRLRYKYNGIDYQYIAVIEKGSQNTQRLHLHCLFFNLPYININEFQAIWKYGFVNMNAMSNSERVGTYMLKSISKTLPDCHYIEKGKKFYITSIGLKKPIERHFNDLEIAEYINNIPQFSIEFEREYHSLYVGDFNYKKIRIKK